MTTAPSLFARWDSIGIGFDGAGLLMGGGSTGRFYVNWGDGTKDFPTLNRDEDDDGVNDAATAFHSYASDGTYHIAVFQQPNAGLEPVRLNAYLYAGATNDLSIGGSRLADMISGGTGSDFFRGADGNDWLAGGDGNDLLKGQNGDDVVLGGAGNDRMLGGDGVDLVGGDVGDDVIYGESGNDFLFGDVGADLIYGGDDNDFLDGGAGVDRLSGGAGADVFSFAPLKDSNGQTVFADPDRDSILDFQQGSDHIDLAQWGPVDFIGGSAFHGAAGELRSVISGGSTIVQLDYDGDRVANLSVRLAGNYTLTQDDFYLAASNVAM